MSKGDVVKIRLTGKNVLGVLVHRQFGVVFNKFVECVKERYVSNQ